MRKNTILSVCYISAQIFALLCALHLTCGVTLSEAASLQKQATVREPALTVEMLKILPVLEDKIVNRKLLEKSREKVLAMDSRELHLVAALCEKISDDRQTVSSDIAFLLVSALIVLS